MTIKTIIFDLDGTLLYSLEDLTDCVNITMREFGFPTYSVDEVRLAIGNGVKLLIDRLVPSKTDKTTFIKCLEYFKTCYTKNMYNKTKPYNGIIKMLTKLKSDGYKIAVLSNKFDSAVKELCNKYFDGLIDIALGQKENVKEKPSPDGIYEISKELNCSINECLFVGDSEVDIQTAQNANIDCISVVWGYKDIEFLYNNGASKLIYLPEDIHELL